ncbi:secretion system X translation initiation factor [Rhizobacter sp. SG703]|uniref:secretion system X translation initiation factor n=1 Tax=Rhizobacter sp. SG703 TaxID=2587140 RepID=UPI001444FB22|nr:secretion system X translation initiation factor [Rhizobacter sp. SG703]NKI95397.1 hypothetical protein [Rhizobacter sp. SG703]
MKPVLTRSLLGLGLGSTLLAAWFAPAPASGGVELAERTRTAAARAPAAAASSPAPVRAAASRNAEVLRIRPREGAGAPGETDTIFGATRWTPPPAPVVAAPVAVTPPPPPPPPQAPPLPFRVLGRYDDAGELAVFLQYNDQNLVVRVGDTVAQNYKVESLQGGTLTLVYTPLNQKQTLDVGGSEPRDTR